MIKVIQIFTFTLCCIQKSSTAKTQQTTAYSHQIYIFVNFEHNIADIFELAHTKRGMSFAILFSFTFTCDNLITNCCSFAYCVFLFVFFIVSFFMHIFFLFNILITTRFKHTKKSKLMFQFVTLRLPSQAVIHLECAWAPIETRLWLHIPSFDWLKA